MKQLKSDKNTIVCKTNRQNTFSPFQWYLRNSCSTKANSRKDIDTRNHLNDLTANLVDKMIACGSSRRSVAGSNQRHRKPFLFHHKGRFCWLGIGTSILLERYQLSNQRKK